MRIGSLTEGTNPGLFFKMPSSIPARCQRAACSPASILVMVANAAYFALLLGNIVLIVASLLFGPRLLWLCRVAVFVNGIALILMLVPLLNLLLASHPFPEYRAAILILVGFTAPILIEILVLLAVLRWRMRPHCREGQTPKTEFADLPAQG
jgi:hypothetical protein